MAEDFDNQCMSMSEHGRIWAGVLSIISATCSTVWQLGWTHGARCPAPSGSRVTMRSFARDPYPMERRPGRQGKLAVTAIPKLESSRGKLSLWRGPFWYARHEHVPYSLTSARSVNAEA